MELDDDLEVYFTVNLAKTDARNTPNPGSPKLDNLTIQCENPYVPASIKRLAWTKASRASSSAPPMATNPKDIEVNPVREQKRYVISANGKFQPGPTRPGPMTATSNMARTT